MGYARVSSYTQKDDSERQIELMKNCAKDKGQKIKISKRYFNHDNFTLGKLYSVKNHKYRPRAKGAKKFTREP